jgi:hypothetical protein
MDDQQNMRASDADRQQTVDRLKAALDEGRLKLEEYLERMGHAYEAVTYADLVPLTSDLPRTRAVAKPRETAPAPATARPAEVDRKGWFAGLPKVLRLAWTGWSIVVSVNVVVWVLVCVTSVQFVYPWPLWVAGPWGAILLALSATTGRRGQQPPPHPLPPGEA